MNPASELYPQYCSSLAPTQRTYCLMYAKAIHDLDFHPEYQGQNTYHHRNLPIKWARVVGAVVAIDDFYGRRVYTVDDSSGACIECSVTVKVVRPTAPAGSSSNCYSIEPPKMEFGVPGCEAVDVGHIVDVKGLLSMFRCEMTIQAQKLNILKSTEDEVALWERRILVQRDILGQPWVLTEKQIRRCRRAAEEGADEQQKREEREQRRATEKTATRDSGLDDQTQQAAVELDSYGRPKKVKRATEESTRARTILERDEISQEPDVPGVAQELDQYGRPKKPRGSRAHGIDKHTGKTGGAASRQVSRLVVDESMRGKYSALGI